MFSVMFHAEIHRMSGNGVIEKYIVHMIPDTFLDEITIKGLKSDKVPIDVVFGDTYYKDVGKALSSELTPKKLNKKGT